jgi:hypothetical protein
VKSWKMVSHTHKEDQSRKREKSLKLSLAAGGAEGHNALCALGLIF